MKDTRRATWMSYGAAVIAAGVATLARLVLDPILGDRLPYALLFLAILIVAGSAGRGPALLTTALGALGSAYFFLKPRYALAVASQSDRLATFLCCLVGLGIAMLGGALRAALRRSESSLDEAVRQRERSRITLSSIGDAVIVTDAEGRVESMNPVAERLTGWPAAAASGVPLRDVFRVVDEATRAAIDDPAARASGVGGVAGPAARTILIARDGGERLIEDSAAPIHLADGSPIGAVLVFRDVTERGRHEGSLSEAHSRLESTLAAAEVGTWEFDVDRNLVRADRNLARFFGVSDEDAAAGPLEAYTGAIHPDDRARVAGEIGRALEQDSSYETEYRLGRTGGPVRWVVARGRVIRDAAGLGRRMPGVVLDITGRKQVEGELRESETRFRTLFDSMDEGFCVIQMLYDPAGRPIDYRFLEMNPAFERHSGLRDAVGRTARQLAPALEEHWFEAYGRVALTGEPIRFVSEATALGGRWFDVNAFRLGGDGSPRVAVLFNDITARKRAEAERSRLEGDLRKIAADLSEADRRKDEFLATLAHELRNPLAPIRNALRIMRLAGDDRLAVEESRALMERQVAHMVRLIDDLMDVSRITRNKMELRRERVDLATVIRNALDASRPLIDAAGHAISVELPDRPTFVDADLTRLAQVFSNLLNNAAKYTDPGGRIALSADPRDDEVMVTVRDNGVGIPPERLREVFELFTQVDRSIERSQGGLGIGLSLVRTLVEMHEGSVEARSEGHGLGSEFVVTLPVVRMAAGRRAEPGTAGEGPTAPGPGLRILVVDDNQDAARTLARLLKLLGHDPKLAHDGGEAVEQAEAHRPDLMLLDIGLPVMNGYEVARAIRQRPWGRDVTILALTGWGQEADRLRSKEAGFDAHLVKPVDPAILERFLAETPARSGAGPGAEAP